jgi:hypothetical protein
MPSAMPLCARMEQWSKPSKTTARLQRRTVPRVRCSGQQQIPCLRDMDRHGQGGGLPWPWFWPVAGDGFLETSGEGRRAVLRI